MAPRAQTPDQKDDDGTNDRANEACSLTGCVPAETLTEPSRDEGTDNPEDRRQDEALRLVPARRNQLGDDAGDESDDDRPDYTHGALLLRSKRTGSATHQRSPA